MTEAELGVGRIHFNRVSSDHLSVRLAGEWRLGAEHPPADAVREHLGRAPEIRRISFNSEQLTGWDSLLLTFLTRVVDVCEQGGIRVNNAGLPRGVQQLLALASAVQEKKGTREAVRKISFLAHVGEETFAFLRSAGEMIAFIGESTVVLGRFLLGRARWRGADFALTVQECGARALPIVSLISLLVGLILAFVGAVQLSMFGAEIYVADLVGIAMVRVMGAVMTGIIMAGRTGGAFAAQLGTMEVNEEIDALRTLGISPMEFLVLPRMLSLAFMMPLLCLYADFMGILGGLIVGVGMLDLSLAEYVLETRRAVGLDDLWIGLFQGAVFGILVALAGCLRGMQCKRSAAAVGDAATSAVVTGIVSIIVATALVTVICNVLGI